MLWDWVKQGETAFNTSKAKADEFFGLTAGATGHAPTLTAPLHSQFARNVKFFFYVDKAIQHEFIFPVNPEEFVYDRPERIRVTKTLGEPFVDDFGIGLPTLSIRGTTGWRTRPGHEPVDGYEAYRQLHRELFDRYFAERDECLKNGIDPDKVELLVVNGVDELAFVVVPTQFKLLRSKSRPLLYQYDLNFTVIEDRGGIKHSPSTDPIASSDGWLDALRQRFPVLVATIEKAIDLIERALEVRQSLRVMLQPVFQAAATFIGGVGAVLSVLEKGVAHVAAFINAITDKIRQGLNAVRNTQRFIQDLPLPVLIALGSLQSVIHEVCCYLANGARESWLPDFTPVEGASDCGTTRGVRVGSVAANPALNGIRWVSDLAEAARNSDITGTIGFVQGESVLSPSGVANSAPVIAGQNLGGHIDGMTSVSQNLSTPADVEKLLGLMVDVMGSVSFDPSSVNNDASEYLTQITQFKTVEVGENDSLQSIALRELGDALRWREIAAVNDIIVESPMAIFYPIQVFTLHADLDAGGNVLDYGQPLPAVYAAAGDFLELKDVRGNRQRLRVEKIEGSRIVFYDTFSRIFTGPVRVTRYVNRADLGVYEYSTKLAAAFPVGLKKMTVQRCKDIYPGYVLYLRGNVRAQSFTVRSVNYLESVVEVLEPSVGFSSGIEVQIYDTESRMHHLEPGFHLKIPVTGGVAGKTQTDREVYGTDIELDEKGLLRVAGGDMAVVTGLDNLRQAIYHRIVCPYESNIIHPQYGCSIHSVIGRKNALQNATFVKATLIEALNREPRINRVLSFDARPIGDTIAVAISAQSVEKNSPTDLNFVLRGF